MTEAAHVAIVLAAGSSRRLGRAKQLLTREGETLVHRAVRLAINSGAARVLLVTGARAQRIEYAVADLSCDSVHNVDWETGLASSVAAAARALGERWLQHRAMILGCDQPALDATHLRALLAGADRRGHAATRHGERPGIPAVVPVRMLRDALQSETLRGDVGLGPLLRALPDDALDVLDAPALRFDLDTLDDLACAVERGWIDVEDGD